MDEIFGKESGVGDGDGDGLISFGLISLGWPELAKRMLGWVCFLATFLTGGFVDSLATGLTGGLVDSLATGLTVSFGGEKFFLTGESLGVGAYLEAIRRIRLFDSMQGQL